MAQDNEFVEPEELEVDELAESEPADAAAAPEMDFLLDETHDVTQLYLNEIGREALLTPEEERVLALRNEAESLVYSTERALTEFQALMDETDRAPEGVDRREFLNWTWKGLGAVLVVEAAWTTYDLLNPKSAGGFGGVVEAGQVAQFPEGTVRYFLNGRFYVTSVENELYALYQKCPHLGCRVPFCSTSRRFECPCHGSKFNLAGEYIEGPTPRGMDRFPVTIEGDKVLVDTGDVVEGPPRGVQTVPSEAAYRLRDFQLSD